MLVASTEEKQELEQAIEYVKKMGYARDARIVELETEGQIILKESKYYYGRCLMLHTLITADLKLKQNSAQAAILEHLSRAKDYHITVLQEKLLMEKTTVSQLIELKKKESDYTVLSDESDEERKFNG